MRGAEELVTARKRGTAVSMVFVDLDLPRIPLDLLDVGHVLVEDSDRLSGVDLRCVHGLPVCVSGENGGRTKAFAQACSDAGATRVIASVHRRLANGETVVVEVTDSKGVLTWTE